MNNIDYPNEVLLLWRKALSTLLEFENDLIALITFGSFVNGDLYFIKWENRIKIVSDFEFAVIVEESKIMSVKDKILHSVSKYNKQYSSLHFGHNLNIKVNSKNHFFNAVNRFSFFNQTLMKTGKVIYGADDLLNPLMNNDNAIPFEEIAFIYKQKIYNLLLHITSRITENPNHYPLFLYHLLINSLLKLSYVLSCYYGFYPENYKSAIKHLRKYLSENFVEKFEKLLTLRYNDHFPTVSEIRTLVLLTIDIFKRTYSLLYKSEEEEEEIDILTNFLFEYLISLDITNLQSKVSDKKRIYVKRFLEFKNENYDFYKQIYHEDE